MRNPENKLRCELERTSPYESLGMILLGHKSNEFGGQRTHSGPSSVCRQFKLSGTMLSSAMSISGVNRTLSMNFEVFLYKATRPLRTSDGV